MMEMRRLRFEQLVHLYIRIGWAALAKGRMLVALGVIHYLPLGKHHGRIRVHCDRRGQSEG